MTGEVLDSAAGLPEYVIPPFTDEEIRAIQIEEAQAKSTIRTNLIEPVPHFRPSPYLMDRIRKAETVVFEENSPVKPAEIHYDEQLSELVQANVWTVNEIHQVIMAYKIRGAWNFSRGLNSEERKRGMITASAGNHAQGIAVAANMLGMKAEIYMPEPTPKLKIERVRALGGAAVNIVIKGRDVTETLGLAQQVGREKRMVFAEPFNDLRVVAGQGTLGMEIADKFEYEEEPLDYGFLPVGGYGLFAGVGTALKTRMPSMRMIAVEPEGAASLHAAILAGDVIEIGEIDTHVDGAAVKKIGHKPFLLGKTLADGTIAPTNEEVNMATTYLWERELNPIRAELAGSLSVAGLFKYRQQMKEFTEKHGRKPNVIAVISGGNLSEERYLSAVKNENYHDLIAG